MTIKASEALSITTLTVWAMILFLFILVGGLGLTLIQELQKREKKQLSNPEVKKPKGF